MVVLFGLQLIIPTGTTSIISRLDGHFTGLKRHDTVAKQFKKDIEQFEFKFDDKRTSIPVSRLGYMIQTEDTLKQIPQVRLRDKLIPLAAYVQLLRPANAHTRYVVDEKIRLAYIGTMSNQYSVAPTDAKAIVSNNLELTISKDKPGYRYGVTELQNSLSKPKFFGNDVISLKGQKVDAKFQPDAFKNVSSQFENIKDNTLTIAYSGKTYSFAPKEYAPMLEVVLEADKPKLHFSEKGYGEVLASVSKSFGVASGISDSSPGATRIISVDVFKKQIAAWLLEPTSAVVPLPTQVITRATSSNDSLQTVVSKWVQARGAGYYVYVQELGGAGRSAQYNSSQQTVLASTYKLFVAWAAYRQAESGALSLAAPVYGGQTIEQCISRAIINSDNECAKAVGKYIGWAKIQSMAIDAGFTEVRLNNYFADGSFDGDKTGSAAELATFLARLHAGTLINSAHTNTLLGYMKKQTYRGGIPAGSSGAVVADKVGFLSNYTHDAGIVYSPNSTYVLVIMSDRGNNWANIRSLSSAIYLNLSD